MPVIDHWWQTETAWPIAANCVGLGMLPVKPGSPTQPVPGYDVRVLDEQGAEAAPRQIGSIVIKLPMPPGCLPTLWNNDAGFEKSYMTRYPGHYLTGDAGYKDDDGYVYIMSRVDDIINVAGHRLSTGSMEAVIAGHPAVAECAVIGVHDSLKGQAPRGFVVLKAGADVDGERVRMPRGLVRDLLRAAPAGFTQHARNPERSVEIGGDNTVFAPVYGPPFVRDLDNGRRYGPTARIVHYPGQRAGGVIGRTILA